MNDLGALTSFLRVLLFRQLKPLEQQRCARINMVGVLKLFSLSVGWIAVLFLFHGKI